MRHGTIDFKKIILGFRPCINLFSSRYSINNHKSTITNPVDDIRTCRIVTALQKTIDIQGKIEVFYPEVEKETLSLALL
jgi:hypothetical protein